MSIKVCSIVAMSENRVIGVNNKLPWHISEDLKRFSKLTTGHTVIMGRKTFESLPEKYRPLPKRKNVVITRNPSLLLPEGVRIINDVKLFIDSAKLGLESLDSDLIWIIGGEEIFKLTQNLVDEVHLTIVKGDYQGDVYLPEFEKQYEAISREEFSDHIYIVYSRTDL